jgi:hypothetical protein
VFKYSVKAKKRQKRKKRAAGEITDKSEWYNSVAKV